VDSREFRVRAEWLECRDSRGMLELMAVRGSWVFRGMLGLKEVSGARGALGFRVLSESMGLKASWVSREMLDFKELPDFRELLEKMGFKAMLGLMDCKASSETPEPKGPLVILGFRVWWVFKEWPGLRALSVLKGPLGLKGMSGFRVPSVKVGFKGLLGKVVSRGMPGSREHREKMGFRASREWTGCKVLSEISVPKGPLVSRVLPGFKVWLALRASLVKVSRGLSGLKEVSEARGT
jgi:hypothetical protein